MFKTKTTVESTNKLMIEDYAIEQYNVRNIMIRTSLAAFAAVIIHLDAQIKHTGFRFADLLENSTA